MNIPLLSTKLLIPAGKQYHITRPRLERLLAASLDSKITLVSAPAGYGKTTLVSDWIYGYINPGLDVPRFFWISLDEGDNDLGRFMAYFSLAFQDIVPRYVWENQDGFAPDGPHTMEVFINSLINQVVSANFTCLLILDDYHLIQSLKIHQTVNYLIDHLPPNLHLILITRSDPPLHLARMRASGEMIEIRQDTLRFTPHETLEYLVEARGLPLSADQVNVLTSRTEGWIAGLQMVVLALLAGGNVPPNQDFTRLVKDVSGNNSFFMDYMMEEVLSRQSITIQYFLLHTAILKRLSGSLCDALMEGGPVHEKSQQILETLEHSNLFILPLDLQHRWYRYHHLFAELLRQHLAGTYPDDLAALHRRASRWYKASGLLPEAIDHALEVRHLPGANEQDLEYMADLVEAAAEETLSRSEMMTFVRWVSVLPESLVSERPYLGVYYALALMFGGGSKDKIETLLDNAMAAESDVMLQGVIALIQDILAGFRGGPRKYERIPNEILAALPVQKRFLRSFIIAIQSITEAYFIDLPFSMLNLDATSRVCRQAGNWMAYFMVRTHIGDFFAFQGKLHAANEEYDRILNTLNHEPDRLLPVASLAYISKGNVLREWNDLDLACQYLQRGMDVLHEWGEFNAMDEYMVMAQICMARGDFSGAQEQVDLATQLAIKFDLSAFDDRYVATLQIRLWIIQGNLIPARLWAQENGLDGIGESRAINDFLDLFDSGQKSMIGALLRELELLSLARLRIAEGQIGQSQLILYVLLERFEKQELNRFVIEVLLLLGLTYQTMGDFAAAQTIMERALALAEPEGFIRLFLDEGPDLAILLARIRPGVKEDRLIHYVARLLEAFHGSHPASFGSDVLAPTADGLLSQREREVLMLLTAGLSNQEIADRMVIALSTVKTHIHSIYQKLGVNSRTLAVARAREFNLN